MGNLKKIILESYTRGNVLLENVDPWFNRFYPSPETGGKEKTPQVYQDILQNAQSPRPYQRPLPGSSAPTADKITKGLDPYTFLQGEDGSLIFRTDAAGGRGTVDRAKVVGPRKVPAFMADLEARAGKTDEESEQNAMATEESLLEEEGLAIPWEQYIPTDSELEKLETEINRSGIDLSLDMIVEAITGDPNMLPNSSTIARFWRWMYDNAETRVIPPLAQKELIKLHSTLIGLSGKISPDGVVRASDLTQEEKDTLSTTISRKSCSELWVGTGKSRDEELETLAPNLNSFFQSIPIATDNKDFERYGYSIKSYSRGSSRSNMGDLAKTLCDAKLEQDNGDLEPLIKKSSDSAGHLAIKKIKTAKEGLSVGILNFALNKGLSEEVSEGIQQLASDIQIILEQADLAGDLLSPIGGLIDGEDAQAAAEFLERVAGIDLSDGTTAAKAFLSDTIVESIAMSKFIAESGVAPLEVVTTGKFSTTSDKKDYKLRFANQGMANEFYSFCQRKNIPIDKYPGVEVGISLKGYLTNNVKGGTGSFKRVFMSGADSDTLSDLRDDSIADAQALNDKERSDIQSNLRKGRSVNKEVAKVITPFLNRKMSPEQLSHTVFVAKTHIENAVSKNLPPYAGSIMMKALRGLDKASRLDPANNEDYDKLVGIAEIVAKSIKASYISRNPSLLQSIAVSDLIDGVYTPEDELISMSSEGKNFLGSSHDIVLSMASRGKAVMNKNLNMSFKDPESGKKMGSCILRSKASRIILDFQYNAITMSDKFVELVEGQSVTKEVLYRKLEKIIQVIEEAL